MFFNFTFVKSGPLPGDAMNPPSGPNTEGGNDLDSSDFPTTAFSSILQSKLLSNDILTSLFRNPIDGETAANMASAIAESLVLEVGVVDSYSATNLIIDALISVNPNAGPEAYCTALTNVIGKILLKNKILNSENYFTFANMISRIILNVASDLLNAMKKISPININKVSKDVSAGFDIGGNVLGLQFKSDYLDTRVNLKPLLGVNANVDSPLGANLDTAIDMGKNSDLSVSEETNIQFKLKLTNELQKDITFRNVFSDYIPPNTLKQIAAAVCQYISKAFHVSRLFLLPLETRIGNLSFDSSPTPELYGNIITNILTDLFGKAKFITKGTASLQGIIAAKAITSGITNLIRIASIPGEGFSSNENTFNSYFSILNGLEKLPYVGVEAASPKLPLAVKLTYASRYASQFANILFYNLISSSKFLEIFSPDVSTVANKLTAKSLGKFVAEAFGSPNPNLFYDLYSEALLVSTINVNGINYAKALSFATARALFLNGYFLSGNINIQAAIAKNAIIRALTTKAGQVPSQGDLFQILGLPWVTQLEGVLPSQILLKYGTDVGLNAKVGENIDTKINAALGAGVNVNSGLGTGVSLNAGLGADLAISTSLGEKLGTNISSEGRPDAKVGLGGILGSNAGLSARQVLNVGLKEILGANIDLGRGQATNVGLGEELGTKVGLRGELSKNFGLGGGLGAKVDLRKKLNRDVDLGGGLGAKVDLREKLNRNVDLGGEFGANIDLDGGKRPSIGLGGGIGSNVGLSGAIGTNMGLEGGLGSKIGLGTELDVNDIETIAGKNAGLGNGLDINIIGANAGANVGSGTRLSADIGLGSVDGLNTNLGAIAGLNSGLGAVNGLNTALREDLDVYAGLKTGIDVESGLGTSFGDISGLRSSINRKKRSINDLSRNSGVDLDTFAKSNIGLNSGVYLGAGIDAGLAIFDKSVPNARLLTDVNKGSGIGTDLGARLGINTNLGSNTNLVAAAGTNSNAQLSVLNVLPLILADKLYQSTALYTSFSIAGARKVINLISQAMAGEFGLPIATIFLRSYDQFVINNVDNTFETNMVGLAKATAEALAGTGLLSSKFSLSTTNQLADAVVSKFSSLIATSLETKECITRPQWTYLLSQDVVQPPLISGYNIFK